MIHVTGLPIVRMLRAGAVIAAPAARGLRQAMRPMLCWMQIALFAAIACLAPGTMPVVGPGGLTVVLCTDSGPVLLTVDANGDPVETQRAPCAWSVHAAFIDPGPPASAVTSAEFYAFAATPTRTIAENSRDWSDQNRPRGPPRFL